MAKGTLALRQIQLGDNADTSKNFVISVPAVADGTLVIKRGNGADVLSIAADGKVTLTPTTEMTPIGVGQTWQDVTANRSMNTTYTNTTGRPIMVSARSAVDDGYSQLTVGGIVLAVSGTNGGGAAGNHNTVCAIVPGGASYSYQGSAIALWAELR